MKVNINDESSRLKAVVVGTAEHFGGTPTLAEAYDPKSKEHIINGTFPIEEDLTPELQALATVLEKYGVKVYRPEVVQNCNQVFARDIGFVIEDKFIRSNIITDRSKEFAGIEYLTTQIDGGDYIEAPETVKIEGGDVMPWRDKIFIGYSKQEDFNQYVVSRTNEAGVNFIRELFPSKQVHAFELNKSDDDPKENALHLDCCFQPIGEGQAIIHKDGFKNEEDYHYLVDYFGLENIIEIDKEEMYLMFSNVFSINPTTIVSEQGFIRLNSELRARGFTVEEVPFAETAKMEGLLRCSTLPLVRE